MFAFEKFPVYIKTSEFIKIVQPIFKSRYINPSIKDQLYRSSSSILLNIAEGAGKFSPKEKKNFYTIARGSAQESVSIIQLLKMENNVNEDIYNHSYALLTDISKMLSGLINAMNSK